MAVPPLRILVFTKTYNSYGGDSSLSLIGRYLQSDLPALGDSIREIEITVCFRNSGRPKATLELMHERFAEFVCTLPATRFLRKKGRFELVYLSNLGDASLVEGFGPPRLALFVEGARELATQLTILRSKVKPKDQFATEAFLEHVSSKIAVLPTSQEELTQLAEKLESEGKRERDAMDEWEKLGIDWEDYHPNSRAILDDPFFWDCVDDFAPHGNDTGADVLAAYMESKRRPPGVEFLDRLMRNWGMSPSPEADDAIEIATAEEAWIALAFAQVKLNARIENAVRTRALDAIASCRARHQRDHADWNLLPERLCTLDLLEQKLRTIPD